MKFFAGFFLILAALPLASAEAGTARYACSVNVTRDLDSVASVVWFSGENRATAGALFVSKLKNGRKGVTTLLGTGSIVGHPGQEYFKVRVTKTFYPRRGDEVSETVLADVHLAGSDRVVVENDGIETVVICAVGKE